MSESGIPIIGQAMRARLDDIVELHVASLNDNLNTHKVCAIVIQDRIDSYFAECQKSRIDPNAIFMEQLNTQIAINIASISQIKGQFALLAAMGVTVPLPGEDEGMKPSEEDTIQ